MLSWENTLINITNNQDHQLQCDNHKQLQSITIGSVGRYTVILSAKPKASITNELILQEIKEEYGLEQDQFEIQNYELLAGVSEAGGDLATILGQAQVKVTGDVGQFKADSGMGIIEGYRKMVNDGNTIIFHFWDSHNHYVLLHEIKY